MTSDSRLRFLITVASTFCEHYYEKHTELKQAMYHVETEDGDHALIPSPPLPKDEAVELMRALFAAKDVARYVLVSEAWILDSMQGNVTEEDMERANREGLADFNHPARREIVMITAEDRERQLLASREIIREDGVMRLGPLVIDDNTGMSSGRMIGLLRPRGRMQ
jgi:hypothetical protein